MPMVGPLFTRCTWIQCALDVYRLPRRAHRCQRHDSCALAISKPNNAIVLLQHRVHVAQPTLLVVIPMLKAAAERTDEAAEPFVL